MAGHLVAGSRVSWKSSGGTAHGRVVREATEDTTVKNHKVRASKEKPQYIVESDNGGRAAHQPSALTEE